MHIFTILIDIFTHAYIAKIAFSLRKNGGYIHHGSMVRSDLVVRLVDENLVGKIFISLLLICFILFKYILICNTILIDVHMDSFLNSYCYKVVLVNTFLEAILFLVDTYVLLNTTILND